MDVARALWDNGPATVRKLFEAVSAHREIDFTTVQTYLRRLERKGYASSTLNGRIRVYAAKTKPQTVIRDTVNELVNRLFGGEKMPLVRHLIEDPNIDSRDIAELRKLIDKLEASSTSDTGESEEQRL
ncbi:MAG: CopY/TcrY family copper transport repressor [Aureliella sp.]